MHIGRVVVSSHAQLVAASDLCNVGTGMVVESCAGAGQGQSRLGQVNPLCQNHAHPQRLTPPQPLASRKPSLEQNSADCQDCNYIAVKTTQNYDYSFKSF